MWGSHKKKLQSLHLLTEIHKESIEKSEEELRFVNKDLQQAADTTQRVEAELQSEQDEHAKIEGELRRMQREREAADLASEGLWRRIQDAQEELAAAAARRQNMFKELAEEERIVKVEHDAAERSADAAVKETIALRTAHDAERKRWHLTRQAHDELQKQVASTQDLCGHTKVDRDAVREQWSKAKDELSHLGVEKRRLLADHALSQQQLDTESQRRAQLGDELRCLNEEHSKATETHRELEERFKMRKGALTTVAQDLERKKVVIHAEIEDFQKMFEDAKAERERLMAQNDMTQEELAAFLPEYFKLQTAHSARRRELEMVRRRHEMLLWEQHKIHRDLNSLTRSYEPLLQIPA